VFGYFPWKNPIVDDFAFSAWDHTGRC
jgi:hypothetical protein